MKKILNAPNVNSGGGKVLLISLLRTNFFTSANLDKRLELDESLLRNIIVTRCGPNIFLRFYFELLQYFIVKKGDYYLSFNNLPPLLPLKAKVDLFVQNRLILTKEYDSKISIFILLRTIYERFLFKRSLCTINNYYVQTDSMKELLHKFASIELNKILIKPFYYKYNYVNDIKKYKTIDFIYAADGSPHKNHINLIKAWIILAKKGYYPSLYLTISINFSNLLNYIENEKSKHKLNIYNLGEIDQHLLIEYYTRVNAIIYPSYAESFGLSLVEASDLNIPILAPECDYVRDVVNPVEVFNPYSPNSIALSVMRYKYGFIIKSNYISALDFVNTLNAS